MDRERPALDQPSSRSSPRRQTEIEEPESNVGMAVKKPHCPTPRGRKTTFPSRVHTMLSDVEAAGRTDIAAWQPHGRAFIIRKPKDLVTQIMPLYFKQTKWSSFQRQLNIYGFSRLTCGVDRGCYYHPKFLVGRLDLCGGIIRRDVKGTKVRVPSDAKNEPNFYAEPALEGARSDFAAPITHDRLRSSSPSMSTSIVGFPKEQVSNVAMLPQHAMMGSGGDQETRAAYGDEVRPTEYASQRFVPTPIDYDPSKATRPTAMPFHGPDHSTPMSAFFPETEDNTSQNSCSSCEEDTSCSSKTNADDLLEIPDDLVYLQDAFTSLNKPFIEEDLDKLPKNETEWIFFLDNML